MITVRPAEASDIPPVAAIRAKEWETESYWTNRIRQYLSGDRSPQQALAARVVFVAADGVDIVGFVAGHLTRRFGCVGELEWINVAQERRGEGIAGKLMAAIAEWFAEQGASASTSNHRMPPRAVFINVTERSR